MGKIKPNSSGVIIGGLTSFTSINETPKKTANEIKSPGESKKNKSEKPTSKKSDKPGKNAKPSKSQESKSEKVNSDE